MRRVFLYNQHYHINFEMHEMSIWCHDFILNKTIHGIITSDNPSFEKFWSERFNYIYFSADVLEMGTLQNIKFYQHKEFVEKYVEYLI